MAIKRDFVLRFIKITASLIILIQTALANEPVSKITAHWLPLSQDELHDPSMLALKRFKSPGEILSKFPRDGAGNQVDWVKAFEQGYIKPQTNLGPNTSIKELDLEILFRNTGEMDMVLFQHKQHTEWLACSNCHESIFKSKAGATKFGMFDILNGEYCGRCHGAVAFPLTECKRCHNQPRSPVVIPAQTLQPQAH